MILWETPWLAVGYDFGNLKLFNEQISRFRQLKLINEQISRFRQLIVIQMTRKNLTFPKYQ